ncbi:MAG TPA: hypothetical protein VF846_02690 [Thermoanaerobaculia bacterium]
MDLRSALLNTLIGRFGADAFVPGTEDAVAVFPEAHADVGPVIVCDDGDEATVTVGTITHGHFNDFDQPLAVAVQQIAIDVADFLEALFAGRVVLWRSRTGMSAGWRWLADDEQPTLQPDATTYLWQGPIG